MLAHVDMVVVLTGGSRGIGKALANQLRATGVIVITCSLHSDEQDEFQYVVDVQKKDEVEAFSKKVFAKYGTVDVLINNAGWCPKIQNIEEVSIDDYGHCMRTNVDGVFNMLHAFLPSMKKNKSGMIITIASRAGTRAHPGLAIYSASKFAAIGLTQAVAKELEEAESNVLCFSVSPGGVATDMRQELFGEQDAQKQQSPEVVASLVLSLIQGDHPVSQGDDIQIVGGSIVN